jgi:hypothetical protein
MPEEQGTACTVCFESFGIFNAKVPIEPRTATPPMSQPSHDPPPPPPPHRPPPRLTGCEWQGGCSTEVGCRLCAGCMWVTSGLSAGWVRVGRRLDRWCSRAVKKRWAP